MEYQNFHPHILPVYPFGFFPFHPQFNIPAWSDESPVPLDLPIWCNMFKMTSFHSLQAIEVPPRDTLDSQGRPFGCYTPDGRRKEWKKGERDVDTSTELSGADKLRGLKAAAMRSREAMKKKRESSRATEDDGPTEVISTNTTDLFVSVDPPSGNSRSFIQDPPPHLPSTQYHGVKAPLPPVSLPSQGPGIIQLCKTKRPPNTKAEATCDSYPVLLDHSIDLSLEETEELDFIPFPPSSPALSSHLPIVISSSPDNLSPPRHVDHTPSPKTIKSVTTQQKSFAHFVGNKDKKKKKKRSEKKLDSTQQGAAR
ncbi:hypothetical protein L486_08384 [Kwoniella mangroviensis CBS 10435]|uniref:Uncharacterized protein n=1 Tax=Kwoniella mangroviensis CBS 10435 TaxID=1331196 RepID=A0A1B9IFE2_9TREE|nr:hypothetical protein L486_08384 [Kwoniella mangroviensis CBS 10435]